MLTIDYEDYTKKGLKPLLQKFDKAGLPVKEVEASNKSKRENGYAVKSATLTFESGQILVLKIKAGGSLYQAKLNGKVLAIKNYIKADTFTDEVLAFVRDNEAAYAKQKQKQLSRAKVLVPKVRAVNTSTAEQVATFTASLEEFKGANEAVQTQLATIQPVVAEKQARLSELTTQLDAENAKSAELQKQLDGLKNGIMESAYFPKAGTPEHIVQKAGYTMVQDEGKILGFRDFGKTGKMVPVAEYKKMPKEVLAAMKAVIQDDLDYEDDDGKHPFHLDNPIKHIFEAAGTAPVQLDRLQIANDMMHGDGRHPKLKAAFIDGFNNSCSMDDAILFIESFSDEELMALLKSEENIFEGVELKVDGKVARLSKGYFLNWIKAPEDAPILEAIEQFNAFQEAQGATARAMILECGDTSMGTQYIGSDSPTGNEGEVPAAHNPQGSYAINTAETGWDIFQDTTVLSPFTYPPPLIAVSGARGDCPRCAAEMEPCEGGKECPVCGCRTDDNGMLMESAPCHAKGSMVTLKGFKEEGDSFAGKRVMVLEAVPTAKGLFYKVENEGMVYRGVAPAMILEAIPEILDVDHGGYHDANDPDHINDPDVYNYGGAPTRCFWCGSQTSENVCIACNRKVEIAATDRKEWENANKPLPADDFPSNYE